MTTTSMTTQEMNNFLEYQKSYLRVQRDELKAIKDQEEAKLKQIKIGESIVSMLEGLLANGSGIIEGVEEEKIDEEVRETDTSQGISALEQIADYSSDEEDNQKITEDDIENKKQLCIEKIDKTLRETDTSQGISALDQISDYSSDDDCEVDRISLDEDIACDQVEMIIDRLSIKKKVRTGKQEAIWCLVKDITLYPKLKRRDYKIAFCILEKHSTGYTEKGLITTPDLSDIEARELGLVKKFGSRNRYKYLTLGKPVEEVKELIIKLRDIAIS